MRRGFKAIDHSEIPEALRKCLRDKVVIPSINCRVEVGSPRSVHSYEGYYVSGLVTNIRADESVESIWVELTDSPRGRVCVRLTWQPGQSTSVDASLITDLEVLR